MPQLIIRWQDWANAVLDNWLITSPFASDCMFYHAVPSNAGDVGAVLISCNVISAGPGDAEGQEFVNIPTAC